MNIAKVKELCERLELLRQERFHLETKYSRWSAMYNRALNELIRECHGEKVDEPQKIFAEKI